MKKIFFILVIFFQSIFVFSQISGHYFDYNNYKASAETNASYEFNSNCITNKFLDLYLLGSHIDNQNKKWMFAELKPKNYFGADIEGGLSVITFPDTFAGKTNLGLFVKYYKYYHIDIAFTDDLFKLFFDGNEQFAGKTANLNNSSLNALSYDQLQIGIISKHNSHNLKRTFGAGISVNNGYQNTFINIEQGSLYTDPNAEFIDFSAKYKISRSDFPKSNSGFFNGAGASINLYYTIETPKKNIFDIQLTNLGFIRWDKHSQQFSKDTSIHFEGITVNDILNIQGNIFSNANTDSIVNAYTYSKAIKAYNTLTPACLKISYMYNLSTKFRSELSITKKFFSHYAPCFVLKTQYLPDKKNIISLNISYGGYSTINIIENHNLNAGIEYAYDFGKGFVFLVGSNYLNSLIYPYSTTAQGAFFAIKKYFL